VSLLCFVLCLPCFLYCFVYVYLFLFVLSGLVQRLLPKSENSVAVNNNNNNNNMPMFSCWPPDSHWPLTGYLCELCARNICIFHCIITASYFMGKIIQFKHLNVTSVVVHNLLAKWLSDPRYSFARVSPLWNWDCHWPQQILYLHVHVFNHLRF
jgi:hypothetical protein